MDFVMDLPQSLKNNNVIWVIMNCLIKLAHFILFRIEQFIKALVKKYMHDIVQMCGILITVIPDKYIIFRSQLWKSL